MEVSPEEFRVRAEAFADRLHSNRPELDRDELTRMLAAGSGSQVDSQAEQVVDLAIDRAGLAELLPDDSVPAAERWRQDLADSRRRLTGRVVHGLSAATAPEETRDSLNTLSGQERGRDLADQVTGAIEVKRDEYTGRGERDDWSVELSAADARLLDVLDQQRPVVSRPAGTKPASRKVTELVQQVSAVVNEQTGANSPVRQVGVDPHRLQGVRIAGPDAIVIGVQDHAVLEKIGSRFGVDKRFDKTAQALAGVTEAVTDLAVRSDLTPPVDRPPAERGVWDRPLDREYLGERAEHQNIQQAVTAASTDFRGVVEALAGREAIGQRFADLALASKRPSPAVASVGRAFAETLNAKLVEAGVENPPAATGLLAEMNRRPPELKARVAADRVLAATVPGWSTLHDPPHDAALGRLSRRIGREFDTQADGRQVGEGVAAEAVAIRAELAPFVVPAQPQRQAAQEVSTDVAFAGTDPLGGATRPGEPSSAAPAVADGTARTQQTERKW